MDTNNDDKPTNSFLGKSFSKSFSWYREVSMERNITTEVTEKQRATRDDIAKALNARMLCATAFWIHDVELRDDELDVLIDNDPDKGTFVVKIVDIIDSLLTTPGMQV